MVLFLGVTFAVAASAGGGISFFLLFRRQHARLKDEELPRNIPGATENDAVSLHSVSKLTSAERKLLVEAFLVGSDSKWLAGIDDHDNNADKDEGKNNQQSSSSTENDTNDRESSAVAQRQWKITEHILSCMISFAEHYGHVVVARDKTKGTFLGSVSIIPPYKNHKLFLAHMERSLWHLKSKKPLPEEIGLLAAARWQAFEVTTMREHDRIMDHQSHFYITNLGVAQNAQGQGVGRILSQVTIQIAAGTPLFLECHDGNLVFYEKMGYTCQQRYRVAVPPLTTSSSSLSEAEAESYNAVPYYYNAMTHQPKKT